MGVRGGKIHSTEEYLIVDSLAERAALVRADHPAPRGGGRMSFRVRPATGEDFRAIYQMAKLTGGGFTNLPADRGTLVAQARPIGQVLRAEGRRQTRRPLRVRARRPEDAARSAAPARCSARSESCSPSTAIT